MTPACSLLGWKGGSTCSNYGNELETIGLHKFSNLENRSHYGIPKSSLPCEQRKQLEKLDPSPRIGRGKCT
jgi:hypothetical protein